MARLPSELLANVLEEDPGSENRAKSLGDFRNANARLFRRDAITSETKQRVGLEDDDMFHRFLFVDDLGTAYATGGESLEINKEDANASGIPFETKTEDRFEPVTDEKQKGYYVRGESYPGAYQSSPSLFTYQPGDEMTNIFYVGFATESDKFGPMIGLMVPDGENPILVNDTESL